jgi:3-dehydroquinate synthetase
VRTIPVDLGDRSYPIYLGTGILPGISEIFSRHRAAPSMAIVTDRNVARIHLPQLLDSLEGTGFKILPIVVPPNERQKSLATAETVFAKLIRNGHPANAPIVSFGGGVVGDLAGFVAATYRRGTPLIHIPTTLLAQVESSIGGKVAVNQDFVKNAIGAYHQPRFVFSDPEFLLTLPGREVVCGMGEILKYAMLDEQMFSFIDVHLDSILELDRAILEETIARCNAFKAKLISEDERETSAAGGRMVLNLGHRLAHALEQLSQFKLHHGEAVLIGLRWELAFAKELQVITHRDFERISVLLGRVGFRPDLKFLRFKALMRVLFGSNGKARFVLPESVGKVSVVDSVASPLVESLLKKAAPFTNPRT